MAGSGGGWVGVDDKEWWKMGIDGWMVGIEGPVV